MAVESRGRAGRASLERAEGKQATRARKPRADGLRNRDRLLEAAKASFADAGADVSLDEIARRAGVGIGTLYRHFPTRDAMVEAVYRREVEQLADAANRLTGTLPPGEALHAWMRLFVDYIATKKSSRRPSRRWSAARRSSMPRRARGLPKRWRGWWSAPGPLATFAPTPIPPTFLRALAGFTYFNTGADWEASARRLIDILMDGLRAQRQTR